MKYAIITLERELAHLKATHAYAVENLGPTSCGDIDEKMAQCEKAIARLTPKKRKPRATTQNDPPLEGGGGGPGTPP